MHLPLAIPFFAMLAGCLIGLNESTPAILFVVAILITAAWLLHRFRSSSPILYPLRTGVLILVFCFTGIMACSLSKVPPEITARTLTGEIEITGNIRNKPKVSRAFARIRLTDSLQNILNHEVLLVYFPDAGFNGLKAGHRYRYTGELKPFNRLRNPGNFDARAYYRSRGISGELVADSLTLLSSIPPKESLRDRGKALLTAQLQRLPHERSRALFTALLSGDKQHVDGETREAFARCGMMHLLAVSGLHTGLLAALPLLWLRRSRNTGWRICALVVALSIVWAFAWFTGFPASVRRASAMLSLLCVGLTMKKRTSGLNLMFGAGVLMLTDDPELIHDIGFQLSFAAVAAILYWGPTVALWIESRRRWVNRLVCGPASVSLTAQAGTTPFSLYYFQQFPLLFLPVNLIAVPFATLLLYAMLIRLLLAAFGLHPPYVDAMISGAANLLIEAAILVGKWKWSAIQGIEISWIEALLWACLAFLIFRRKPLDNRIAFAGICLCAVVLTALVDLRIDRRPEILLFSGMDPPLIGYRNDSEAILIKHYERQSEWLAGGWKRKNDAQICVLDKDTTYRSGDVLLMRSGELITINELLVVPADTLQLQWPADKLSWTAEEWLLNGESVGKRNQSALTVRLNSTGQVGAMYTLHRPPIPEAPEADGFD